MTSPTKINVTIWMCGAILLGAATWRAHERVETMRRDADARLQQRTSQLARLRAEHQRLRGESTRIEAGVPAQKAKPEAEADNPKRSAVREDALRLLARLRSSNVLRPDFASARRESMMAARTAGLQGGAFANALSRPGQAEIFALTQDGRLPEQLARLFQLDAVRFAALQEVVSTIKHQADDAIATAAKTAPSDPGKIVLEVHAAAPTSALRERLRTALTDALGPVQFEAYDALHGQGFATLWSSFGADDRTITIASRPDGSGRYEIKTQVFDEQGNPTGESGQGGLTPALVRTRLGSLAHLLPGDF